MSRLLLLLLVLIMILITGLAGCSSTLPQPVENEELSDTPQSEQDEEAAEAPFQEDIDYLEAEQGQPVLPAEVLPPGNQVVRAGSENLPVVSHVSTVAPDIIAVDITAGHLEAPGQIPYQKQPGDQIKENGTDFRVVRDGKEIGSLAGGAEGNFLLLDEHVVGQPLQESAAGQKETYTVISIEDPNFDGGVKPLEVYRKSKAINMSEPERKFVMNHTLYLKLPSSLKKGKAYNINFGSLNVNLESCEVVYNPNQIRSEAVHVSQVGYRPDDPGKKAFLSLWLGTGGSCSYQEGLPFYLINHETQEVAYEGKTTLAKAANEVELMRENRNYILTDVYQMDFSDFKEPGWYRVYVEGVGCSYPFEIGDRAWEWAFRTSMMGFYHNRSGIELGAPYTDYERPRPFHPDDGLKVYQSTTSLMDSGNGLNAQGTDTDNFGNLIAGKTEEIVPDVWGGYFDAGDWDRRIQHLEATRLQLELLNMFPDYFKRIKLSIPENSNDLPDALDEALWNLDFYRRLQMEDGGIRGGIESEAHPLPGECSWQESQTVMIYAPDIWSSYIYAGVAARAAHWLKDRKPDLAKVYEDSALKAMNWAEDRYDDWRAEMDTHQEGNYWYVTGKVDDERNLAALELYRLTEDKKWNDIFIKTTILATAGGSLASGNNNQGNAAFVYAVLKDELANPMLKKIVEDAISKEANRALRYAQENAFNLTTPSQYKPLAWGFYTTPDAISVVRAHYLTKDEKYLKGIVEACQFAAGANPMNMAFTTGVGYKSPQNPLHIDSRRSGQKVPEGITVYGPFDLKESIDNWMIKYYLKNVYVPKLEEWPNTEAYFDTFFPPEQTEWTIHQTLGPNAYIWGYLAARE